MTTEKDITDLAARLKAAHPEALSSVDLNVDNHSSGRTRVEWSGYLAKKGERAVVSPGFPSFPELQEWVEANWLNKE